MSQLRTSSSAASQLRKANKINNLWRRTSRSRLSRCVSTSYGEQAALDDVRNWLSELNGGRTEP
jgi:hypothetical protein